MQVACSDKNFPQNAQRTQPQPQMLQDMAQAQFCLVMPGNVQSSGHLADAFFTGCIPVFLGPPFHSLPLPHMVNYPHFSESPFIDPFPSSLLTLGFATCASRYKAEQFA